jgi:hypothetical protein
VAGVEHVLTVRQDGAVVENATDPTTRQALTGRPVVDDPAGP